MSAPFLFKLRRIIYDAIYPIGRGFIDFTDEDYSNYLGFTWERELIGMTPVGKDSSQIEFNTIGKTGGEKMHKLTIEELPNITGSIKDLASQDKNTSIWTRGVFTSEKEGTYQGYGNSSNNTVLNDVVNMSFGNDQSHNNLQPYKVVAYWKRIA